ncbi:tryptophan-rich sensory protein [Fusibacter bizertensis]|uniref:Tryptophan-rich sensory protein n=1 Tax=Fusibacter bizertensis TaxID=1488331 RepID=A0ABT6NAR8_9FIRM|nr:tryptophan-rich sensory protein [Fusibacter bizertensis]MDH8677508.1 tryptophan-rich sensory protein [Fusibacter bizertensis]
MSISIKKEKDMKVTTTIAYIFMLTINILANTIPLNNITTGEVSDRYANLFAPTGFTFAIWGLIYLALGGFIIFQWRDAFYSPETSVMVIQLRKWFSLSSLANGLWIVMWHYDELAISVFMMFIILFCLIKSINLIHSAKLTTSERIWIHKPFSLYFGWITIASIANVTTFLTKQHFVLFNFTEELTTSIVLVLGALVTTIVLMKFKDLTYGMVALWSYYGILFKHTSDTGFNGEYGMIITVVAFNMIFTALVMTFVSYKKLKTLKKKFSN